MRLMFQQLPRYITGISICMGLVMPLYSAIHHFSPEALAALCAHTSSKKEVFLSQPEKEQKSTKQHTWLTVDRAHKFINCAACLYALVRIGQCYHHHFISHTPPSDRWYDQLITLGDISMVKKLRFACASTIILGETLVGKSLAKLLLLCATGDITDLIEPVFVRMKKIVMG